MLLFKRSKDPFTLDTNVSIKRGRRSPLIDSFPEVGTSQGTPASILKTPLEKRRIIFGTLFCFVILLIFFIRVLSLQSNANEYLSQAENNRTRILSQTAPRGIIFDRHNIPLTKNSPDIGIFISLDDFPDDATEQNRIFDLLSEYTNISTEEIHALFSKLQTQSSIEPLPLIEHISHENSIKISVHQTELPGIQLRPQILREYTYPLALAHVIGYIGKISEKQWQELSTNPAYSYSDPIGKSGIEESYESDIKGDNGKQRVEVNAYGHITSIVATQEAVPGENITLALDAEFQKMLYDEIQSVVETSNGTGGAAVALDPRNGEVLALISYPSFDTNAFNKGVTAEQYSTLLNDPKEPLFNRVISGEYPSGSTIKPLIASAALQEHIVTPQTTVLSTGGIQVGVWSFPDWKAGGHGLTNVRKAIAESVNTYFYAVGGGWKDTEGLGVDRIRNYAELFGLNSQLGIDIRGEATGFLPTKEWKLKTKGEPWYIGDTYHLAIGQGDLLVTPLQVSEYVSVIANGGTLYKPHLVKKIGGTEIKTEVIRRDFIDAENLATVRAGMRDTVLTGSAKSLQSVPIEVAAKTGTAQFGSGEEYHAWFTAFAPYDHPEIALTILIEGGGEGSIVAAPIARKALTWWAEHNQ